MKAIVVVDDSASDLYVAKRIIEKAGVDREVLTFGAADEALAYFSNVERLEAETGPWPPPVLIMLDIRMPRMSGFELLDALEERVRTGELPDCWLAVMMLTSSSDPKDKARAKESSRVIDLATKPLTVEAVHDAVAAAEKWRPSA